jgi:hypothetical protein
MTPKAKILGHRAVLDDRLQLVLQQPANPACWHWLYEAVDAAAQADRTPVLQALRRQRPAGGAAALLAATFLDDFADDESELVLAARSSLRGEFPLDASIALLNRIYRRALRQCDDRESFLALLRRTGFVNLSLQAGTRLLEADPAPGGRANRGGELRRVAVVAPTITTGYHAPTRMALAHACLLQEQGLEVKVFVPQEHMMPGASLWLGTPRAASAGATHASSWPRPKTGTLSVALARVALSMRARWLSLLEAMRRFEPQAVLFVGPYSPMLWPLHARYPVAGLGTNALAPVGPIDLWLAPGADAPPTWSPPLPAPQVRAHTRRISVPVAASARARAPMGLPDDAVVWMTSGTALPALLDAHWCSRVREALDRHPGAWWLLVGGAKDFPPHVPIGHPRVRTLDYQEDFGAVLLACDLYLNPPRMGGGQSVAAAMAHGVPALTLASSDGGDKAGRWAAPDEAAFFGILERWTRDARARREAGAAQRERFRRRFDLGPAAPMLVDALRQAMQIRTGSAGGSMQAAAPP